MNHPSRNRVITFVGMPGAGKSSCVAYLEQKGFPSVYFGGITVDEVKRRGLEINETNEKLVREEMRATDGPEVMAKRITAQIDHLFAAGQHKVVADGLYSWSEYKYLKSQYGHTLTVIAIVTPRHVRHERLVNRPVRPLSEEQVTMREYSEIENLEKGGPIAMADYYIANCTDLDELYVELDQLLDRLNFSHSN